MRTRHLSLVLSCSALAVACGTRAAPQPLAGLDVELRRTELREAISSVNAQLRLAPFPDVLSAAFAPNGFFASAALDSRGPAAARAWLLRDTLNATSHAELRALFVDVSADGDDGYAYGYLDVVRASGDTAPGEFHGYWRRSLAGRWEILAIGRGRRASVSVTRETPEPFGRAPGVTRFDRRMPADVLRSLSSVDQEFSDSSTASTRSRAFEAFAAPNVAKIGPDGAYVFGPPAVGRLFLQAPAGTFQWTPELAMSSASQDLGFTIGHVVQGAEPAGRNPNAPRGRYLTIWRRQPDGRWRYVVD
ncbi:MAG: hypothetical protein JWO05_3621 [Gemmatimonadetes bacterium]|nr:hypothetical protein [Gemmatimonadota bacterium]